MEAGTEAQCANLIAESPVGKLRGQTVINANGETEAKSFIGIFFDTKRSGEASSHPHARTPSLKDGRLSKLFSAFFLAHNSDTIHESDLFFFFDGVKVVLGWRHFFVNSDCIF